ncbi:hypothetical protein D3C80_1935620 [compost metagenome]
MFASLAERPLRFYQRLEALLFQSQCLEVGLNVMKLALQRIAFLHEGVALSLERQVSRWVNTSMGVMDGFE